MDTKFDSDQKFWVTLLSLTVATLFAVSIIIGVSYHYFVKHRVEMGKLGYNQVTVQGYHYPVWQKAE